MVAIYVRQSIDKKDSISIESQIECCKSKLYLNEEYKIYEDKGFSGKNTQRPKFLEMMKDIADGKIGKVIIYRLDRISRAILDFANMMDVFAKHGVSVVSCNDPIDTTTPMGRAMLNVTMTFAQLERETIQQRIKDNYYARGKQGYYLGGPAPYGYVKTETSLNDKKTYTFKHDDKQAKDVLYMFTLYAKTDISLGRLAKRLTEEGIRTKTNRVWNGSSLGRLLRNPVYVQADKDVYIYLLNKNAFMNNDIGDYINGLGCYVYAERKKITTSKFTDLSQSYVTLALHKGIVPPELWLHCQYKLDSNRLAKNSGKGSHCLSGLLKCGYCGMAVSITDNGKGSKYVSCGGRKNKICYGRKKPVKLTELESYVKNCLAEHFPDKEFPNGAVGLIKSIIVTDDNIDIKFY